MTIVASVSTITEACSKTDWAKSPIGLSSTGSNTAATSFTGGHRPWEHLVRSKGGQKVQSRPCQAHRVEEQLLVELWATLKTCPGKAVNRCSSSLIP